MKESIEDLVSLCISKTLPITISRTEGEIAKVISILPYLLISSKTAGMIIEGRIIDRETFKPTDEVIYLTEEEFLGASLGYKLAEE
jgi:hypothetical protein